MKNFKLIVGLMLFGALFSFSSLLVKADELTVKSISIITAPTNTFYISGENLDLTGLVVELVKSDNMAEQVTFSNEKFLEKKITTSISNGAVLKVTDKKVTIAVGDAKVDLLISVTPTPKLVSISIESMPTTTTYKLGDVLDLSGLKVKLSKSNLTSEIVAFADFGTKGITTSMANGVTLKMADKKVTIKKESKKVDLPISVTFDPACMKEKVTTRETSIITSMGTYTTEITSALTARKTAIIDAWGLTDTLTREQTIKNTWSAFKTAQKAARSKYLTAVKKTWADWKVAAKTCGVTTLTETQASDTL